MVASRYYIKYKMDKGTSDEKLLKLIEGAATLKPGQKAGIKQKDKGKKSFFARVNLKFFRARFNLYNLNRGLYIVSALLTLFFFYTLISGVRLINAGLIFTPQEASPTISKLITKTENRFLSRQEYLSEVGKRNMFLPLEQKTTAQEESAKNIAELVKDLKLVGIIWSSNPEAMIENTKEKRTYLLKKEDTFGELPYKVKDISRNSVVLEISTGEGAKEYELK